MQILATACTGSTRSSTSTKGNCTSTGTIYKLPRCYDQYLLRCVAEEQDGLKLLRWMIERILNAQYPEELRPLFFDGKLMGLQKQSKMAADIEKLASAARRAFEAPGKEEDAMPVEGQADTTPPTSSPSRPPCLWAGESPDCIPCGDAPEPAAWMQALGERAGSLPYPAFACSEGEARATVPVGAVGAATAEITNLVVTYTPWPSTASLAGGGRSHGKAAICHAGWSSPPCACPGRA
eukprot:COSAG01_NODE_2603_length_7393_cov_39.196874_3_plen_237_part_00